MQINEVVSQFLLDLEVKGRTLATLIDYRHRLSILVQLLQEHYQITDIESVTITHLRQCVQHLMIDKRAYQRGRRCDSDVMAPATVRAFVCIFKSFFHWCYLEELIESDPTVRLTAPKVPKRVIPAFTDEHIERMLAACDTSTPVGYRDYVILLLLLDTGMRAGELIGLHVGDVNDRFVKVFGKGRREREIGIHPEVSKLLWKYIHKHRHPVDSSETALFLGEHGRPLHLVGIQHMINRVKQRSGLVGIKFYPHVFRHTFAKMYLKSGGELFKLSREMGHSSVEITKQYLEDFNSTDAREDHVSHSPITRINVNKRTRKRKDSK